MSDYGTKILDRLLSKIDKMTVEEYKALYERALKDIDEFESDYIEELGGPRKK